ncbi:uncharacterized protein [Oryctolagus cuniculus]|uniref:uncharacterized protein n=1 Tax=Oryctolagus cuniculus TaxID=9986 RepID=UPI003879ED0D
MMAPIFGSLLPTDEMVKQLGKTIKILQGSSPCRAWNTSHFVQNITSPQGTAFMLGAILIGCGFSDVVHAHIPSERTVQSGKQHSPARDLVFWCCSSRLPDSPPEGAPGGSAGGAVCISHTAEALRRTLGPPGAGRRDQRQVKQLTDLLTGEERRAEDRK